VTPERRAAQRYTLSHLAHDTKKQTGIGEPIRDWFPISFMGTFTDWADVVHGPDREWGQLTCGCHPNCGIGMAVMIAPADADRATALLTDAGEQVYRIGTLAAGSAELQVDNLPEGWPRA